jgi:putative peptidoglycan lipid II flippase
MNARIGKTGLPAALMAKLWLSAALAAAAAWAVKLKLGHGNPLLLAVAILGCYGLLYFAFTYAAGIPECRTLMGKLGRRLIPA